jgi:soluble lytic murein transglycosylase
MLNCDAKEGKSQMSDVSLQVSSERVEVNPLAGLLKTGLLKTSILKKLLCLCIASGSMVTAYAEDYDFNAALNAANSRNLNALDNFQMSMQDSVLGYYPEYWKFNIDLAQQPADGIIYFVTKYPNSAMAEKLAADYVEAKVSIGDYQAAKKIIAYVKNPDAAEDCAIAQVRAATGDTLALTEYKSVVLKTEKQPNSCTDLAGMLLTSPLMTNKDKQHRLWSVLRADKTADAMITAQNMGISLSAVELAAIAANPLDYVSTASVVTGLSLKKLVPKSSVK